MLRPWFKRNQSTIAHSIYFVRFYFFSGRMPTCHERASNPWGCIKQTLSNIPCPKDNFTLRYWWWYISYIIYIYICIYIPVIHDLYYVYNRTINMHTSDRVATGSSWCITRHILFCVVILCKYQSQIPLDQINSMAQYHVLISFNNSGISFYANTSVSILIPTFQGS